MSDVPGFAPVAALLADPTRALMLTALLDGRARPAGDLAFAARITPQTASFHLAQLLDGGLIALEKEGRHRYYRLASPEVAQAMEQLTTLPTRLPVRRPALSPQAQRLRFCRRCYDHLAGQVGVAVAQGLQQRGYLVAAPDKRFHVTDTGRAWLAGLGVSAAPAPARSRGYPARQCLDWTERQHHLGGPLGVDLLTALCAHGWLRRSADSRALQVTPPGAVALREALGVDVDALRNAGSVAV